MTNDDMRQARKFEETDTLYVVVWNAYGEWRATSPFASETDAKNHAWKYIHSKDYNKLITIIPFPKPVQS